jgi:hypothetical protein
MVVAAISPQHAWQQAILRLADTVVGVAAAAAIAARTGIQVKRLLPPRPVPPPPPKVKIDLPGRAMVRERCIRLPPPAAEGATWLPPAR